MAARSCTQNTPRPAPTTPHLVVGGGCHTSCCGYARRLCLLCHTLVCENFSPARWFRREIIQHPPPSGCMNMVMSARMQPCENRHGAHLGREWLAGHRFRTGDSTSCQGCLFGCKNTQADTSRESLPAETVTMLVFPLPTPSTKHVTKAEPAEYTQPLCAQRPCESCTM